MPRHAQMLATAITASTGLASGRAGALPAIERRRAMDRPPTRVRERVRVELRLPPHVAQMIYDRAQHWDVSLSEAGSRLIQIGHDGSDKDAIDLCR